eukprot:scaffold79633_cov69-Phaeocystis_antarctica.AAC.2
METPEKLRLRSHHVWRIKELYSYALRSQLGQPAGQLQHLTHQRAVRCLAVQHEQYELSRVLYRARPSLYREPFRSNRGNRYLGIGCWLPRRRLVLARQLLHCNRGEERGDLLLALPNVCDGGGLEREAGLFQLGAELHARNVRIQSLDDPNRVADDVLEVHIDHGVVRIGVDLVHAPVLPHDQFREGQANLWCDQLILDVVEVDAPEEELLLGSRQGEKRGHHFDQVVALGAEEDYGLLPFEGGHQVVYEQHVQGGLEYKRLVLRGGVRCCHELEPAVEGAIDGRHWAVRDGELGHVRQNKLDGKSSEVTQRLGLVPIVHRVFQLRQREGAVARVSREETVHDRGSGARHRDNILRQQLAPQGHHSLDVLQRREASQRREGFALVATLAHNLQRNAVDELVEHVCILMQVRLARDSDSHPEVRNVCRLEVVRDQAHFEDNPEPRVVVLRKLATPRGAVPRAIDQLVVKAGRIDIGCVWAGGQECRGLRHHRLRSLQLLQHVRRDRARRRLLKHQRRRECQPRRRAQPARQLCRRHRVDPRLHQRRARRHARLCIARQLAHRAQHERLDVRLPLRCGQRGQRVGQLTRRRARLHRCSRASLLHARSQLANRAAPAGAATALAPRRSRAARYPDTPRTAPARATTRRSSAASPSWPAPCPCRPRAAAAGCSQPGRSRRGTARARRGTRWPPRSWPGQRCPRTKACTHAGTVAACRCAAPPAFGWNGDATCNAESRCNSRSASTPAACSTPAGHTSAASAAASAASPPSHARTVVVPLERPTARNDVSRPCPPRATKPLRDVSTRRTAPRDASNAAPRSPRPPSPPVTSHAPATAPPDATAASRPRRRNRAPWRRPPAHATSDSAPPLPPDDAASDSNAPTAAATLASRGTSALSTRAAGCSRRSTRAKPQLPPCAAPDSAPEPALPRTATAPLVSSSSGGGVAVRHSSCARRTADCTPRTHGATPSAASSSSATPRHARPPTATPSGSLTSCTGVDKDAHIARAAAPNAPAGCTASHWPPGDIPVGAASSAQPTLYKAMAEPSSASSAEVAQGKARRWKRSATPPLWLTAVAPRALCSSACAIVPLYPNDDTPPTGPAPSPPACTW